MVHLGTMPSTQRAASFYCIGSGSGHSDARSQCCVYLTVFRAVRTISTHILQQYLELDPELYAKCAETWEAEHGPVKQVSVPLGETMVHVE